MTRTKSDATTTQITLDLCPANEVEDTRETINEHNRSQLDELRDEYPTLEHTTDKTVLVAPRDRLVAIAENHAVPVHQVVEMMHDEFPDYLPSEPFVDGEVPLVVNH